jgi:CheY-like chemotaxis protein
MVVDDEDSLRRLLRRALETAGHEVVEAADGRQALRLHRSHPAELVVTDILMPEQDGIEVIMALRREAPALKIIAMSGGGRFHQSEPLDLAGPLGAVVVLRKPFGPDALVAAVDRALAA